MPRSPDPSDYEAEEPADLEDTSDEESDEESEEESDEEYDHLYGPSVQARASNTTERVPGQVDQFSDPAESPEEFHMEHV